MKRMLWVALGGALLANTILLTRYSNWSATSVNRKPSDMNHNLSPSPRDSFAEKVAKATATDRLSQVETVLDDEKAMQHDRLIRQYERLCDERLAERIPRSMVAPRDEGNSERVTYSELCRRIGDLDPELLTRDQRASRLFEECAGYLGMTAEDTAYFVGIGREAVSGFFQANQEFEASMAAISALEDSHPEVWLRQSDSNEADLKRKRARALSSFGPILDRSGIRYALVRRDLMEYIDTYLE